MRWPTVQRLGLITAVCSLKRSDNDGQRGGFGCLEMPNLTQARTVHVKTRTVADGEWKEKGSFCQNIDTHLSCVSFPSARCGGGKAACLCSQRDGNRPAVRWSINRASISPLWPSPSSHPSSKSFLKLTCSCWHVVPIYWFLNCRWFSRGGAHRARNALIADLGSVVKFRQRRIETGYASGVAKYTRRTCLWCSL